MIRMKQILSVIADAPKLDGNGSLKYRLWINNEGNLYVQIEKNGAAGTFSDLLFSVSKYAAVRDKNESIGKLSGFDIKSGHQRVSANANDGAFLKAVLRHLLSE